MPGHERSVVGIAGGRKHEELSCTEAAGLTAPVGQEPPQGRAIPADDFYVELATYGLSVETPNAEYSRASSAPSATTTASPTRS